MPLPEAALSKGVLAVEMEAAALYAFAQAANKQVLGIAHVTNPGMKVHVVPRTADRCES